MKLPQSKNINKLSYDTEEIQDQITTILSQNQLAIAAEYARSGEFALAEDILDSIKDEKLSHAVLELQAKIKAQQGDYESACNLWREALNENTTCPECIAGLQRAKSILSSKAPKFWVKRLWALILILVRIGLVMYLLVQINQLKSVTPDQYNISPITTVVFQSDDIENKILGLSSQQEKVIEYLEGEQEEINFLSTQIGIMSSTATPFPIPTIPPSIIDQISFQTDNVNYLVKDNEIEITFEIGIFLYNWLLSEEGKTVLKSIGTELEQWIDDIQIQVIGFTDDTEKEQSELSYFRSYKAVEFLSSNCRLSEDTFVIVPTANRLAPYPNDSLSNRLKNRSIMLIITQTSTME